MQRYKISLTLGNPEEDIFTKKHSATKKKVFVVTRLNAEKCFINFFRVPPAVIVLSSLSTFSGMSSTISGK